MKQWYYMIGADEFGPVDSTQLKQLAVSGTIPPTASVRPADSSHWMLASKIRGLFAPSVSVASSASASQRILPPTAANPSGNRPPRPAPRRADAAQQDTNPSGIVTSQVSFSVARSPHRRKHVSLPMAALGIGGAVAAVLVVSVGIWFAQRGQESETFPASLDKASASNIPNAADPVAAFEQLVATVKKRAVSPVCILRQMPESRAGAWTTGGKWIREESTYRVDDYDVTKTDSVITPFVGKIVVKRSLASFLDPRSDDHGIDGNMPDIWFNNESEAMAAKKATYSAPEYDSLWLEVEFIWKNGVWQPKESTGLYFPYSDDRKELNMLKKVRENEYIDEIYKDRPNPKVKTYTREVSTSRMR